MWRWKRKARFLSLIKIDPLTGQAQLHLTRDGRFASAGGFLVAATSRLRVMGESDQPIEVGSGDLRIDPAGRVYSNDEQVGRLQVVSVPDVQELRKVGRNLLLVCLKPANRRGKLLRHPHSPSAPWRAAARTPSRR